MSVHHVTDGSFDQEVLSETSKFVLVDFWAEWCGPCKMLGPVIESMAKKFESTIKVCKLDTDENPVTSQNYQITGIPCCILFKEGKEVGRLVGFRPEGAFESELKRLTQ